MMENISLSLMRSVSMTARSVSETGQRLYSETISSLPLTAVATSERLTDVSWANQRKRTILGHRSLLGIQPAEAAGWPSQVYCSVASAPTSSNSSVCVQ